MSVISRFIYIEQSTTALQLQSRNIGPFLFPENHSTETYRFFLIWSLNWTVLHIQDLRRHSRERCRYILEENESSGRRLVVFNVIFASYNVANSMDHIQALWLAVPLANDRELALVGGRGEEIGEAILFMKRKFSIIFHQTIIKKVTRISVLHSARLDSEGNGTLSCIGETGDLDLSLAY